MSVCFSPRKQSAGFLLWERRRVEDVRVSYEVTVDIQYQLLGWTHTRVCVCSHLSSSPPPPHTHTPTHTHVNIQLSPRSASGVAWTAVTQPWPSGLSHSRATADDFRPARSNRDFIPRKKVMLYLNPSAQRFRGLHNRLACTFQTKSTAPSVYIVLESYRIAE